MERASTLSRTLAFHHIENRVTWGITNYPPRRFERLMSFLAELRREGRISPEVTFDDAYQSFSRNAAPVLRGLGFRAKVFVPTGYIGRQNEWDYAHRLCPVRHLSAEEIRFLLHEGVEFQAHGAMHRDYTALSVTQMREDMQAAKAKLEDLLGREVNEIAYPYGRYNSAVEDIARQTGFVRGWSMNPADNGPFTFGRWGVYSFDTPLTIMAKLDGAPLAGRVEMMKANLISRASRLGQLAFWTH